jgi:hypothetical protein
MQRMLSFGIGLALFDKILLSKIIADVKQLNVMNGLLDTTFYAYIVCAQIPTLASSKRWSS